MTLGSFLDFGSWSLDPRNQCVLRGDEKIQLRPKAYALLAHLIAHPRRIVTKDELLDAVWPDAVVGDAVLKVCMRELRVAIGDDARSPHFLETVHRRGYRFLAEPAPATDQGAPHTAPARSPIEIESTSAEIVGREWALAELDSALEQARNGRRQLVFITGEPGLGKTTLLDAFTTRIRQAGTARIARGGCLEHQAAAEPYLPFLEAVASLCRGPGCEAAIALLRRLAPTWLVELPWLLADGDRRELQHEIRGATRERMLRELCEWLEAVTRDAPVVLALEDLHWSDPSSLDLLTASSRRRASAQLLVLATYRPVDVVVQAHPLRRVHRELEVQGFCRELVLTAWTTPQVEAYIRQRLPGADIEPGFDDWLQVRTEGNPLFVHHTLEHLLQHEWLQEEAGVWKPARSASQLGEVLPEDLRGVLEVRLERLEPSSNEVLEAASLAGLEFSVAAVGHALQRDRTEVEMCLELLARQGLFLTPTELAEFPDGTLSMRYRFRHALYRDVLRRRVPPARRVLWQRRLAQEGERTFGAEAESIAGELAVHFEQGREFAKCVHYASIAADRAARRFANEEALDFLELVARSLTELSEEEQQQGMLDLLERRGIVLRSMGAMPRASEAFEALAQEATHAKRRDLAARAWLMAASAQSWFDRERCLASVSAAEGLADALGDEGLEAHVRGSSAYWRLLFEGWREGDAELCAEAVRRARETQDEAQTGLHLARLALFQILRADYAAACRSAAEARELAARTGDAFDVILGEFFQAWGLLFLDELDAAADLLREARRVADLNGHRLWILLFDVLAAWVLHEQGKADKAQTLAQSALEAARHAEHPFGTQFARAVLAGALVTGERPDQAEALFEEADRAVEGGRFLMDWICAMPLALGKTRCALVRGAWAEGLRHARKLEALASTSGELSFRAMALALTARTQHQAGKAAASEKAIAEARQLVGDHVVPLAQRKTSAWLQELESRPPAKESKLPARKRTRTTKRSRPE